MTDSTHSEVEYIDQYALRVPRGGWIVTASPDGGSPRWRNDAEQAYTYRYVKEAMQAKARWDNKLTEFGSSQCVSIHHRRVTLIRPEYAPLEVQPATATADDPF